jgi:hypothetical protein
LLRHLPDGQLASLLSGLKLSSSDVNDIVKLAKTQNYQLACQRHFDITHPGYLALQQVHLLLIIIALHVLILISLPAMYRPVMLAQMELFPTILICGINLPFCIKEQKLLQSLKLAGKKKMSSKTSDCPNK